MTPGMAHDVPMLVDDECATGRDVSAPSRRVGSLTFVVVGPLYITPTLNSGDVSLYVAMSLDVVNISLCNVYRAL